MDQTYFKEVELFFTNNSQILFYLVIWSAIWKGWALWKAGQLKDVAWFAALLIINTAGILEIVYIFVFSQRGLKKERKHSFTESEAKEIGKKIGIKWDKYDIEQFRRGLNVELEHGLRNSHTNVTNDDFIFTGKIAMAHLNEFSDYYTRLGTVAK